MNQTLRCRLGASSPQKFKLNLYSVSILVLILIHCPDHAAGTITIISELFNTTVATINDLPARFIPERFSFYGIQVIDRATVSLDSIKTFIFFTTNRATLSHPSQKMPVVK